MPSPTRQNSRNPADLHPRLAAAFALAAAQWAKKNPTRPAPKLCQTFRGKAEQTAFWAQGRRPLAEVNALRAKADNLGPLTEAQNKAKVTNATFGLSAHNVLPAGAFDVYFDAGHGKADYDWHLFAEFNVLLKAIDADIQWLGDSTVFKEAPHWQLRDWKQLAN